MTIDSQRRVFESELVKNLVFKKGFRFFSFLGFQRTHTRTVARGRLHDTKKRPKDYPIIPLCYDERYTIIATPINSNEFTDVDLQKVTNSTSKNKTSRKLTIRTIHVF